MRTVLFYTSEASSLAAGTTSSKYQRTTLTCSLPLSMLNHLKVSWLNCLRRKLTTFWRSSRVTMSRWLLRFRWWTNASYSSTRSSSSRDALALHQLTMAVETNLKKVRWMYRWPKNNRLKMVNRSKSHNNKRQLICKRSRIMKSNKWTKMGKTQCEVGFKLVKGNRSGKSENWYGQLNSN